MDRLYSSSSDGFGGHTSGSTLDEPYGARSLGATTDADAPATTGWGDAPVQADGGAVGGADVHATAAQGVAGAGGSLPYLSTIQQAFGRHDVGGVRAHVGGEAGQAADAIGAEAYATGDHVAFRDTPSLHTAAHEAAHVVQQRAGVHLKGGVGAAGDAYEQHADAVADRVVAGQSAEDLLDEGADDGEADHERAPDGDGERRAPTSAATPAPATQKRARTGGAPALQLAITPATVIAPDGAGLHKSNRKKRNANQSVTVRSGGLLGTGKKETLRFGTSIKIDRAKPVVGQQHVYAEHGTEVGYVKKDHVRSEQIGQSDYFIVGGQAVDRCVIFDRSTDQVVDKTSFGAEWADAFRTSLEHILAAQTRVDDIPGLIRGMIKQHTLGVPPDPGLFQLAAQNLDQKVAARVQTDKNQLVQANLITAQHELVSVKFTGADFHKGGQAPLFLEFAIPNTQQPDRRRVVYKPGNLGVDRQLFGSQPDSLAKKLDQGGTQISHYTILDREDAQQEKYGFMEFVESDTPRDANDLLAVYRSLGANMAVGYLAGLEDVHYENVLLLRNRVQVIDMEATTGMFSKKHNQQQQLEPNKGGFSSALWDSALHRGIRPKLEGAVKAATLLSAPDANAAQTAFRDAFKGVLDTAKGQNFDNDWQQQTQALGGLHSRIVPLATASFYILIEVARKAGSLNAWQQKVDGDVGNIATTAGSNSGHTLQFVKNVLRSPGTYAALLRGEVPFFKRDLGSTDIFDEAGTQIPSAGCSKVGGDIATEMGNRRNELRQHGDNADVFAQFAAQMVPLLGQVNQGVLALLQERRNQNQNRNQNN
ncbi:MAG TPA: DUF4135 domain-containing protein [Kofleriaceae bacterium]|nr:DUF4135 domain-containing protein [Kofleriaceae bacterium]